MADAEIRMEVIRDLIEQIRPILAGHGPGVQGAVLAYLQAIWVAGHPPQMRERLLEFHLEAVRKLIVPNAKIMGTGV